MADSGCCWHWPPVLLLLLLQLPGQVPAEDSVAVVALLRQVPTCWNSGAGQMVSSAMDRFPPVSCSFSSSSFSQEAKKTSFQNLSPLQLRLLLVNGRFNLFQEEKLVLQELLKRTHTHTHKESRTTFSRAKIFQNISQNFKQSRFFQIFSGKPLRDTARPTDCVPSSVMFRHRDDGNEN